MGLKKDYQEIELPVSGEKFTVRKLQTLDWTYVGVVPDTLIDDWKKFTGKKKAEIKDLQAPSADFMIAGCIRGIVKFPDGPKLCSKQPVDCDDTEFSFFDLDTQDQSELMTAVFSGGAGIPLNFLEETSGEDREGQPGEDEK